jgi:hypothetical protein
LGPVVEIVGYIARAACYENTAALVPYCVQSTFILLGPVLFAASVYMVLGRLIRSVRAEQYSLIRINWLTKIFVASDVFSFMIQGTGSGMMAIGGSMASMAKSITVAGLLVQVIMFGFFIVVARVFEKKMTRSPTAGGTLWKSHLYPLFLISGLIMTRSIFRVLEFAMGQKGYLLSHEWIMYIFDSVLMIAVMTVWALRYPGDLIESGTGDRSLMMDDFQYK